MLSFPLKRYWCQVYYNFLEIPSSPVKNLPQWTGKMALCKQAPAAKADRQPEFHPGTCMIARTDSCVLHIHTITYSFPHTLKVK